MRIPKIRVRPVVPAAVLIGLLGVGWLAAQIPEGRRPAPRPTAGATSQPDRGENMSQNPGWKEVDQLISEQKYEAAIAKVGALRAARAPPVTTPR
ncbi:MAG: hypothetical protein HC897_12530, partial [Thermoanaerobaculia bacterium]|nr:hypothetical protein [Thermoanaerobaculia bacterium]